MNKGKKTKRGRVQISIWSSKKERKNKTKRDQFIDKQTKIKIQGTVQIAIILEAQYIDDRLQLITMNKIRFNQYSQPMFSTPDPFWREKHLLSPYFCIKYIFGIDAQ